VYLPVYASLRTMVGVPTSLPWWVYRPPTMVGVLPAPWVYYRHPGGYTGTLVGMYLPVCPEGVSWWVCTSLYAHRWYPGGYTPSLPWCILYTPGYTRILPSSVSARLLTMGVSTWEETEPWAQRRRFTLGGVRGEAFSLLRCERRKGPLRRVACSLRVHNG